MNQVGSVYGEALYSLALEEGITERLLGELNTLDRCFRETPDFIRLLSTPALSKEERCRVVEESFRGKVHDYLLNFLKILTEKGTMKHFSDCCRAYERCYDRDNGILPVTAVTAVAMTEAQTKKLAGKLGQLTGKRIRLDNRVDPTVMGGVRLDYDGKRVDDTIAHRLDAVRSLLSNPIL